MTGINGPESIVRLIIVERHALFGKALNQALSSSRAFNVIGDVAHVTAAALRNARPDLILLDFDDHDADIVRTMQICREAAPQARVCILSSHMAPEVMQRCLSAGADAFLLKDISIVELLRVLTLVSQGIAYFDPRIAGEFLKRPPSLPNRGGGAALSKRETEIVRLIARGLSNKEIGSGLSLTEKTIKNNVSRIFQKLNITARSQAAVHAIRTGLA